MYETWKPIKLDPRYEVSNLGRFRKKIKKGYRYIKPYGRKKNNIYRIKINGKELNCARLVANAFLRPVKEDEVVYHKNHLQFDNHFRNLEILNRKQIGKKTGFISKARSVVLIEDGEIKKMWRSTRIAAKHLFVSCQTVSDYCNNKTQNKMFNLMWEDDYFKELEKEGR